MSIKILYFPKNFIPSQNRFLATPLLVSSTFYAIPVVISMTIFSDCGVHTITIIKFASRLVYSLEKAGEWLLVISTYFGVLMRYVLRCFYVSGG